MEVSSSCLGRNVVRSHASCHEFARITTMPEALHRTYPATQPIFGKRNFLLPRLTRAHGRPGRPSQTDQAESRSCLRQLHLFMPDRTDDHEFLDLWLRASGSRSATARHGHHLVARCRLGPLSQRRSPQCRQLRLPVSLQRCPLAKRKSASLSPWRRVSAIPSLHRRLFAILPPGLTTGLILLDYADASSARAKWFHSERLVLSSEPALPRKGPGDPFGHTPIISPWIRALLYP